PLPLACRYLSLTPFLSLPQRPARSTLFPYTTLFRSHFCGGILSIHQVTVLVHPEGFGVSEIAERKTRRLRGSACLASQRSVFQRDRKSTRLNSSLVSISYAVFCLKKKHLDSLDREIL